jgi:hypothetical protein
MQEIHNRSYENGIALRKKGVQIIEAVKRGNKRRFTEQ